MMSVDSGRWKLVIRQSRIFELVTRIDENLGPAAAGFQICHPLPVADFNRPAACSTDTDDASAIFLCLIDHVSGLILLHHDRTPSAYDDPSHIRNLDRPEGSQTHMKCDVRDLDAHFLNLCQQLFREMQTCCRCSRRAVVLRINRLIAVLVLQTGG